MSSLSIHQSETYIYNPKFKGISLESFDGLKKVFEERGSVVSYGDLPQNPQNSTFVFPGGQCAEWTLTKEEQNHLLQQVEKGSSVYATCAGAYFCSEQSVWAGHPPRAHVLSLFNGICQGPAYSPELRLINIQWERTKETGHVVVIGGGIFKPNPGAKNYKVLARYLDEPHKDAPAVIQCTYKKGIAILSGPHWEFVAEHIQVLRVFPQYKENLPEMQKQFAASQEFRQKCLNEMLSIL